MNIIARYIHGSADSTDCDALYIVDEMPSFRECQLFCSADPLENRNLCVIRDGIIVKCFKGFPDEVNNSVLATYLLHEQDCKMLITHTVQRDKVLKYLSVLRKFLMELRHTEYIKEARRALKSDYSERIRLARSVDLKTLQWETSKKEVLERIKSMAFQMGQAISLYEGVEVYTKGEIADHLPVLKPYLNRTPYALDALSQTKTTFLKILDSLDIEDGDNQTIWVRCGNKKRHISINGKEHDLQEDTP